MLVYGDRVRAVDPRARLAALRAQLEAIAADPAGLARHAALVAAFLDASELAQGVADALAEPRGFDARDPVSDALLAMVVALARELAASWRTRFAHTPRVPALPDDLALPDAIRCKQAEGYAFYALYPEAYVTAADRAARAAPGPRRVIGLRSIGTGLAALVAAATSAPLPSTVRPRGDPFARRLELAPALAAEWLADPAATIAIADEGPGMSGSSFGAVLDLLEERGAARVEVYPSHAGELGPAASERHRARWRRIPRHVVTADDVIVPELPRWLAELVGPLVAPLEDLSGGAWRARRFAGPAAWPPAVLQQERRKLLARTADGAFVARFAGLGATGERALARAGALHAAGFAPEPRGLVHGFLVERWIEPVAPLARVERAHAIEHVGRYLAFRARALPAAASGDGARLPDLLRMARRNLALALGAGASPALDAIDPALDARVRPVQVDARLHAWEWLVAPDGSIVKTDGVDHCAAHDLVGCQDLAWDIAGAEAELALDAAELRRLLAIAPVDPELLAALRPCYLAFQLGRHALAIDSSPPDEAARLRAAVDRYATLLRGCLRGRRDR